ncbi:MAG: sulfotransferase [Actinomycetota bacterium]
MTKPNLFVVGAAKSGTTSLWAHLGAHPDVYMSELKEPHYFSRGGLPGQPVVKDPVAYARLFEGGADHRYRGEASPSYLWDDETPARIRDAVPDARIVISLRDPVERAYANYWTHVGVGVEGRTFAAAVHDELAAHGVDHLAIPPPYIARGFYDEQVARYLDTFAGATNVLLFDEFVSDVRGTMTRVFEWLGLDAAPSETLDPAPVFPFLMPRNAVFAALLEVPGFRRAGNALLRGPLRTRIDRVVFNSEKPALDPEIRRRLRAVYAPHDARLRELLGRSLPWDGRE